MKKLLPYLIGLSLCGFAGLASAENLIQVYEQAKESNPDLRKSEAMRNAAYEKITETRGNLLPQLGLTGGFDLVKNHRGETINRNNGLTTKNNSRTDRWSGAVSLSQSLFDMSRWYNLNISEQEAGIQDIAYRAQQQQLILDTSAAYFNVLRALDAFSFIQAQKSAIGKQLDQTQQRFKVGLVAITDVHDAQAQYDKTLADEVSRRNDVDNALEDLRLVTGLTYAQLSQLNTKSFRTKAAPLVGALLKEAESNNLTLLSARLAQTVAREQIRLSESGHYPTLDLTASSGLGDTRTRLDDYRGTDKSGQHQVGVQLSVPLYTGGRTQSQVRQAQYNFIGSSEDLESTHRNVIRNVRSSHNNISAAISTITAYEQTVVSAQSSLDATLAGYNVGTRTIVDVLNATTNLYNAKTLLSNARYDYLINVLIMKQAQGSLDENDIIQLNKELGKPISTIPVYQ